MAKGNLYTWGFCTHGQLGLKEQQLGAKEYVEVPTRAGDASPLANADLRTADCGHFHSCVVDVQGNIWSFGRNDRGQLGVSDAEVREGHGFMPRRIPAMASSAVLEVKCGAFHCLAMTVDRTLFSWGCNKTGQLGRFTEYRTSVDPGMVSTDGPVQSFAAGFGHSAAVHASGLLLTWGSNSAGQLGVGTSVQSPEVASKPTAVVGAPACRMVASGDFHLLILAIDGKVMATGDDSYGRLGTGRRNTAKFGVLAEVKGLPQLSQEGAGENVASLTAGGATSAAISSQGRLFTWGGGVWGQLGHGDREDKFTASCVRRFGWNIQVLSVDCAQDHMLAVCTAGVGRLSGVDLESSLHDFDDSSAPSVWMWGRKRLLPKGIGNSTDQEAEPIPVEIPLNLFYSGESKTIGPQSPSKRRGPPPPKYLITCCGGSHSAVLVVPNPDSQKKRKYEAAWCPQMSVAIGPGTKGGQVGEHLPFQIQSRDDLGKDEKLGGLRFRIWAVRAEPLRRKSRKSFTFEAQDAQDAQDAQTAEADYWDKNPFELQHVLDNRDGTYDGSYVIRRPGPYHLHVHMLPRTDANSEDGDQKDQMGEPLGGSPYRVTIASGPSCVQFCQVELQGKRGMSLPTYPFKREGDEEKKKQFLLDAGVEASFVISAFDLLGNAVTHTNDRFVARVVCKDSGAHQLRNTTLQRARTNHSTPEPCPARKTFGNWGRNHFEQNRASLPALRSLQQKEAPTGPASLHVRAKEAGMYVFKWMPSCVGEYSLEVALLSENKVERAIEQSPFQVLVKAGLLSAPHSEVLLVQPCHDALLCGDPPSAEIRVTLLLCDSTGNPLDATDQAVWSQLSMRVEGVAVRGAAHERLPPRSLEVEVVERKAEGFKCSDGVTLTLRIHAAATLSAAATKVAEGLHDYMVGDPVDLQAFLSLTNRAGNARLQGAPCRLGFQIDPPPIAPTPTPPISLAPLPPVVASATEPPVVDDSPTRPNTSPSRPRSTPLSSCLWERPASRLAPLDLDQSAFQFIDNQVLDKSPASTLETDTSPTSPEAMSLGNHAHSQERLPCEAVDTSASTKPKYDLAAQALVSGLLTRVISKKSLETAMPVVESQTDVGLLANRDNSEQGSTEMQSSVAPAPSTPPILSPMAPLASPAPATQVKLSSSEHVLKASPTLPPLFVEERPPPIRLCSTATSSSAAEETENICLNHEMNGAFAGRYRSSDILKATHQPPPTDAPRSTMGRGNGRGRGSGTPVTSPVGKQKDVPLLPRMNQGYGGQGYGARGGQGYGQGYGAPPRWSAGRGSGSVLRPSGWPTAVP